MRGRDWLLSLAGPVDVTPHHRVVDWSDVLLKAEGQRDPAGWLAEKMSVDRSTARKYIAAVTPGAKTVQNQPTRGRTAAAAQTLIGTLQAEADRNAEAEARARGDAIRRDAVAAILYNITNVDVGTVKVEELSGPRQGDTGTRSVGSQNVDLSPVAVAVQSGSWMHAADLLATIIMDEYGADVGGLGDVLDITDYPDGIEYR